MENISVSVRVRPLSEVEKQEGSPWVVKDNRIILREPALGATHDFSFDHVFDGNASTLQIFFAQAADIARNVAHGFNGTIMAYGQTGTGKTHTMSGHPGAIGVARYCIHEVMAALSELLGRECVVCVSYVEICNEEINDLLNPEGRRLQIHESREKGIFVDGVLEKSIVSAEEGSCLLQQGEANRTTGGPQMNHRSSRSHTIFRLVVKSIELDELNGVDLADPKGKAVRVATLNVVDLAGSEMASKGGAGVRPEEGAHTDNGLSTLRTVINKLSEGVGRNDEDVPFKASKLTRLLQPALGGNTKTAVICCVSPARRDKDKSLATLRFAMSAKKITNVVSVNEVDAERDKLVQEWRSKLDAEEAKNKELEARIARLEEQNEEKVAEVEKIRAAHDRLRGKLHNFMSDVMTD